MKRLNLAIVAGIASFSSFASAQSAPEFTCSLKYKIQDFARYGEVGTCPFSMHNTCYIDAVTKTSTNSDFSPGYQQLSIDGVSKNFGVIIYNQLKEEGKLLLRGSVRKASRIYGDPLLTQNQFIPVGTTGKIFRMSMPIETEIINEEGNYQYLESELECAIL